MPTNKINLRDATIEDLKKHKESSITTNKYNITLYVPHDWIENPKPKEAIAANFATVKELKSLLLYSTYSFIERINKNDLVLSLEVVEPYINLFYGVSKKIPEEAKIKL